MLLDHLELSIDLDAIEVFQMSFLVASMNYLQ